MSLITLKDALKNTVKEKYALPSVVADGHIFMEGIVKAAEEADRPVIVMLPGLLFGSPCFEQLVKYIRTRIEDSPVPMVLHLDHGENIETVMQAIHMGFSSVMIDASARPFEENLEITKQVVNLAHACGVSVEAEIGHVATPHESIESSDGDAPGALTRPEEAEKFAEKSGVDALAISIGTVHGIYKEEPHLELDLIEEVRKRTEVPLVMHGSSGLSDELLAAAVERGMNKINFFTTMSREAAVAVQEEAKINPDTVFAHDYFNAAERVVQDNVGHLFRVLGTKRYVSF